jgi:PTH1 family peptidyl-tRNA hydrolase
VGLGNPEPRYEGTPHNIGYAVLDRFAELSCLSWQEGAQAWLARGQVRGVAVCLVKVRAAMNNIGPGLRQLAEQLAFAPERCTLVYDDLDLPLGSVRSRQRGSAGGHRGVASILEAFQSDEFARVKVGIGQPHAKSNRSHYVLTPFDAASRDAVERSMAAACARLAQTWQGSVGADSSKESCQARQ